MVLKLSKKHLKANHNLHQHLSHLFRVGFKIVKETFESKSQPCYVSALRNSVGFKIVKETFESKSQHMEVIPAKPIVGFKIVKETFESKSQRG